MATKEQERKALDQIKKIVESLGDDSYIGMAFEGCFEIAEDNIENDFGCSMKQRAEAAERKVENLAKKLEEREKVVHEAWKSMEALKARIETLEKQMLNVNDLYRCLDLIEDREDECGEIMKEAAEKIVCFAEDPECVDFKDAVKMHRVHKEFCQEFKALSQRIKAVVSSY